MLRPPAFKPRRITGLSLNRMIPNILTLLALCAGMTAIRFAINGQFEWAVIAIIVAGVFDGLDGRVARLLKSTSPFGAQLDSLSDFICFGVAGDEDPFDADPEPDAGGKPRRHRRCHTLRRRGCGHRLGWGLRSLLFLR